MLYRRNFSPAAIFCAEDEASKQAAYRLYERLCGKGIEAPPPAARWQLNERDFGEMNGHTKEEALAQYQDPNQVEAWWLTDDAEPYGGESKSRVRQRVAPFLHQEIAAIRRSGSGGVLLITPPQVRLILDETIRRGGATACGVLPFGQGSLYQV
jgi:bisphosphoglycerate-dependent phosphoglycerate mutase